MFLSASNNTQRIWAWCIFLQYCLIFLNDLQNFEITPKIKTNDPIKAIVWYWCMFMCECWFVYMCLYTFVCVHLFVCIRYSLCMTCVSEYTFVFLHVCMCTCLNNNNLLYSSQGNMNYTQHLVKKQNIYHPVLKKKKLK